VQGRYQMPAGSHVAAKPRRAGAVIGSQRSNADGRLRGPGSRRATGAGAGFRRETCM